MKLKYDISDRPKGIILVNLAIQQMLAILAATIAVPMVVGNGLTPSAAMFGAGIGTVVYIIMTKRRSPMLLGSNFSFVGSMIASFAGGVSAGLGMLGLIIGAAAAGIVYVILALVVKKVGVKWIDKLMPPVVIGPTVSVIGLSLAGNAVSNMQTGDVFTATETGGTAALASGNFPLICGLITFAVTVICSVYSRNTLKLIPFLAGIIAGYTAALAFTLIGLGTGTNEMVITELGVFEETMMPDGQVTISTFFGIPDFVLIRAADGLGELTPAYIITIVTAYVPVAFVGFAEHIADHKNLSSIINKDLLTNPGLDRTLLGDGLGSIAGAIFGGCANTTYGESIACVALTGNASTITALAAAVGCMLVSFITPFVAFINSIPSCVMGGLCIALYGFIAVSGLKMIQKTDLDEKRNIFVISAILVAGIGGLSISFGAVTITEVAAALILGILTNWLVNRKKTE
ncbi:MAG: uracil-xanthine permease [Ruminiclostridium sp.]|nr:uracil-xanthine permease [Ruminiclostridium sp.]